MDTDAGMMAVYSRLAQRERDRLNMTDRDIVRGIVAAIMQPSPIFRHLQEMGKYPQAWNRSSDWLHGCPVEE